MKPRGRAKESILLCMCDQEVAPAAAEEVGFKGGERGTETGLDLHVPASDGGVPGDRLGRGLPG